MTGISLHMQWPLTSQSHGSFLTKITLSIFIVAAHIRTAHMYVCTYLKLEEISRLVRSFSSVSVWIKYSQMISFNEYPKTFRPKLINKIDSEQCDQTFCYKSAQFCTNIAQIGALLSKKFLPKERSDKNVRI
jgi:hypothetical protein